MKIYKKISLIVFISIFIVSIFSINNVLAAGKIFSLTKAEIKEKTDTAKIDKFSFKNETINSDVTFHKVGDYVTYNLVIKNITDKTYTISEITDNNKNTNIVYEYDKNKGKKVKKGESINLLVKALYKKGESDFGKRDKNLSVTFTINYVDESGKKGITNIVVNPSTGDKVMILMGTLLISLFIILGILISKKRRLNKKLAVYLMILSLVLPISVSAASQVFSITLSTGYELMDKVVITVDIDGKKEKKVIDYNTKLTLEDPKIDGKKFVGWKTQDGKEFDLSKPIKEDTSIKAEFIESIALLDTGTNVNLRMKALANDTSIDYVNVDGEDFEIEHIVVTKNLPEGYQTSNLKTISIDDSMEPVYIWWDSDSKTMYWYTEAKKIMLNEDSAHLFEEIEHIKELSFLKHIDSSKATTMNSMFAYDQYLETFDGLQYLDTSNVTDMHKMFSYVSPDLSLMSDWDVSKVTDMGYMLIGGRFTSLEPLANWKTSNVENMEYLFYFCSELTSFKGLENWDTANVTNMSHMLSNNQIITSLDGIENFNTSNVTDMSYMFEDLRFVTDISAVKDFDVSKVKNMNSMFSSIWYLEDISPLANWNMQSVENVSWMFSGCSKISGTLNLRGNITNYSNMFYYVSTNNESSGLTVNYSANLAPIIDQIIATKSSNSKVYKGVQLDN